MKRIVGVVAIAALLLFPIFGQAVDAEKSARELREFERNWITASMNHDRNWLEKFFAGKLFVSPPAGELIENRTQGINEMIESEIPAGELTPKNIKVRITGNINVITNSASQSINGNPPNNVVRTFSFLDTFNKNNGKWQLIASNFLPLKTGTNENAEQAIIQSEREWRTAFSNKNFTSLKRIIADDFVGIESSGRFINKTQAVNEFEAGANDFQFENLQNLKIRTYGQTSVVTGQFSVKGNSAARLNFTDIWVKNEGQWQIVNYQATRLK